eukprot:CFRG8418T1
MGSGTSKSAPTPPLPQQTQAYGCPVSEEERIKYMNKQNTINSNINKTQELTSSPAPECPVDHADSNINANSTPIPDQLACASSSSVSSEPLDPTNNMFKPDQSMHPKQVESLDTERVTSSIPRVDGHKWVYPSPQMFYNAMSKKGWSPEEQDMSTVVAIHNNVNEETWRKVLIWESLHRPSPDNGPPPPPPKLVSFCGKPTDLTPKARFRTWLGYDAPFDRHDWIVERNGEEVRYVIDFYAHDPGNDMPPITLIDARPAIDSLQSFVDRFRMRGLVLRRKYGFGETASEDLTGTLSRS